METPTANEGMNETQVARLVAILERKLGSRFPAAKPDLRLVGDENTTAAGNRAAAREALDEAEQIADHAEAIAEVLAHFNAGNEEDPMIMRRVAWDLFGKLGEIRKQLEIARAAVQ